MSVQLISPSGQPWRASSPAEVVRLKARGYTDAPTLNPEVHTVSEVLTHIESHPDEADAVVSLEKSGRKRKTITGEQ